MSRKSWKISPKASKGRFGLDAADYCLLLNVKAGVNICNKMYDL